MLSIPNTYRIFGLFMTETGNQWYVYQKMKSCYALLSLCSQVDAEGPTMEDAAGFFANVFGGERFEAYVRFCLIPSKSFSTYFMWWVIQIGEISLMKEMTNIATTVMSEEDKADMEREMKSRPSAQTLDSKAHPTSRPTSPVRSTKDDQPTHTTPYSVSVDQSSVAETSTINSTGFLSTNASTIVPSPPPSPSPAPEGSISSTSEQKKKGKQKLTPEQRKKLDELEKERRKAMEERVKMLTEKLLERIRPFVEAKNPGHPDDQETVAFEKRMQLEADDLKLESFGVEVRCEIVLHVAFFTWGL